MLNVAWFTATAVLYWLLCVLSVALSPAAAHTSPVWLSDGFALGVFMLAPPGNRLALLAGIFAANIFFTGIGGQIAPLLVGSIANVLQTWLAGLILLRMRQRRAPWHGRTRATAFIVVAVVGVNAVTALAQAANAAWFFALPMRDEFSALFISNALGLLLLTPIMTTWTENTSLQYQVAKDRNWLEAISLLFTLIATTIWAYSISPDRMGLTPPYFYLVVPLLLWAVVRFSSRGAGIATLIYSLIAIYMTSRGGGPFLNGNAPITIGLLRLQEFLVVLGCTIMFMAAILEERSALFRLKADAGRRFNETMRISRNLIFDINYDSRVIRWAGDTEDVLGIAAHEISSTTAWTARVHPDDRGYLIAQRNKLITGEIETAELEYRVKPDAGDYITIGVNAFVQHVRDATGVRSQRRVIGFVKDITARKLAEAEKNRLEAELRQAQKMEAVGQLAGGIAHDFNNILASIIGYGEMAQQRLRKLAEPPAMIDAALTRYLDTIAKAAERGRVLVSQILTFSRKNPQERLNVNIADVLDEVVTLVRGSSPHEVRVAITATPGIAVNGNPTELHQLFMNLATNGLQAMPDGGSLDIEMASVDLPAPTVVMLSQLPPGEYVVVRIRDHGVGIDAETRRRMFEPFFTTKTAGRGTGLGLSLAISVAKAHGGGIDVDSVVGAGATFSVYLPVATGIIKTATTEDAPLPRGGGERIMVVDDDKLLLALAEEILSELGYVTTSYSSSIDALTAFENNPGQFDAVLSDEIMPGLTGTQMTSRMHARKPDLPVLIITAYGGAGFELRAQQAGAAQVLKKPYQRSELARALHSALGPLG